MRDAPEKRQVYRLRWIAAALLLLLVAMLMVPFLLTTSLVRLVLGQVFPAGRLSVGRAALYPSGTLVLHDLVLHDTGALAQQPSVTARQVDAAFGWAAVLSRRIRWIDAAGVTVYTRPNSPCHSRCWTFFSSDPHLAQQRNPLVARRPYGSTPSTSEALGAGSPQSARRRDIMGHLALSQPCPGSPRCVLAPRGPAADD
jgi:hypothetical protein